VLLAKTPGSGADSEEFGGVLTQTWFETSMLTPTIPEAFAAAASA
jgi:hypothetical protein